jgi:broad specificity phosphatase PhoE
MTQIDRDQAPAYLQRYLDRQSGADVRPHSPITADDTDTPAYVVRARERAAERARLDQQDADGPPVRTRDYAANTTAPREIVPPEWYREKLAGSADVRLIRHGETQGYSTDGGLTPLGRWQAHRRGQELARGVSEGMVILFPHAPTARAKETADGVREGLLQAMARYGIDADVRDPQPEEGFKNFQAIADGKEEDVTQSFIRWATALEDYERSGAGNRPGWMVEMDRFWANQAGGGDPITHWLTMPMQYFEPAAMVVRRFWQATLKVLGEHEGQSVRAFVCTHSGPIRAVATAAFGHDPGEPHNTEDVRIRVMGDRKRAIVTYRGRGQEIEIPCTVTPSWYANPRG